FKPNKNRRLFFACFLTLLIFLTIIPQAAKASGQVYYEQRYEEPIAQGVTYIEKNRFTQAGWQKIHILKIDLQNPNLVVDSLLSSKGLTNPQPLTKIAEEAKAIAAVNGDFFYLGQTNAPLGPMVKNGEIICTPFWSPEMSVFSLTEDLKAILGNWSWSGEIVSTSGARMPLGGINKTVSNYDQTVLYNRNWGQKIQGYDFSKNTTAVLTVKDGVVVNCSLNPTEILIPEKGFILVAEGETANQLVATFPPGTGIEILQSSSPELNKLKMAIGGGSNLVYKGIIPSFTHNITGKHQRTALGVTEDNKYMFLVVVEGRNSQYPGMTQEELAELMRSLGCYYAINLDGGGSSTLVTRPLGEFEIKVRNSLENGQERRIPNGIGIFSTSPQGQLAGLKIETSDTNIPLWGVREFTVKGYDQYYNPVSVDPAQVQWSVSNNLGKFEGNLFASTNPGRGLITAKVGNVKASLPIRVIGKAEKVIIEPSKITLSPGGKQSFTVSVVDEEGFRAKLSPIQIFPQVTNNVGKVEGTTFTAGSQAGTGMLIIKYDLAEGYCPITVGTAGQKQQIIEDFEGSSNYSFLSYPEEVGGSYEKSTFAHTGTGAAKLTYSFVPAEKTQAAYLVFGDKGIDLPKNATKLGIWVYNDQPNGHWLRAQITNKLTNEKKNIDLAAEVNWNGWKYVETTLPSGEEYILNRIYLVETNPTKMNAGEIYLDDLTVTLPLEAEQPPTAIKQDKNYTLEKLTKPTGSDSFLFTLANSANLKPEDYSKANFTLRYANQKFEVVRPDGTVTSKALPGKNYGTFAYQTSRFIILDTKTGSIRTSDQDQWNWLIKEINEDGPQNLFVLCPIPLQKAADKYEIELLLDLLAQAKEQHNQEVWLISPGTEYSWEKREGVHLVQLPLERLGKANFLVKGKQISYSLEK
ncbi:MAG TPA: phosphodiester glycosidase family protein, partial [Clostridia bacterium]|nr:phosphodiester glycosidase family protein [Clostridia bacterium]